MWLNELNNLNKLKTTEPSALKTQLSGSSRVIDSTSNKSLSMKNKGKLIKRVSDVKSKKEKKKIIEEWVLEEISKINKDSEVDDF